MENENQEVVGLTIKDIFNVIKRSWVSILVCVICGVIICTGILSILRLTFSTTSYEAKFTLNNKYITTGMSPWDTTYNPSADVKSGYIVNKALQDCGFEENEIVALQDKVIKNLSINPIVIENNQTEEEFYSYSYNVILDSTNLKITDAKAKAIVDAIIDEYIVYYKNKYQYKSTIGKMSEVDFSKYSYVQLYENLSTKLNMISILAKEMAEIDGSYRSTETKLTFNDIVAKNNNISINLTSLVSILTTTAAINTQSKSSTELNYVNAKYSSLNNRLTVLESQISDTKTFLENIKPEIMITGGTATITNEEYYKQIVILFDLQEEERQLKEDIEIWKHFKTAYEGTTDSSQDTQAIVNTFINNISDMINENIDDLQKTIETYNEEELLKNAIKKTSPSQKVVTKNVSNLLFIVIELIIFALSIGLGILINNIIIKKKNKKIV